MKSADLEFSDLCPEAEQFEGILKSHRPHCHSDMVIGLMTEGSRTMKIRNRDELIQAGSLFLIPAYTSHGCYSKTESLCSWRVIRLRFLWQPEQLVLNDEDLTAWFLRIHQTLKLYPNHSDPHLNAEIYEFLDCLMIRAGISNSYDRSQKDQKSFTDQKEEAGKLLNFMKENCSEKMKSDDLEKAVHMSRSGLQRLSVRLTGLSVHRLLISMRIDRARHLLLQGVLPGEAAVQCGFSDQAHFSHVFSSLMAITPGRWIQQAAADRPQAKKTAKEAETGEKYE